MDSKDDTVEKDRLDGDNEKLRFAGVLRAHREAVLLTQEGLATRAGMGLGSIKRFERGKIPRLESVRRLADALKLKSEVRDAFVAAYNASKQARAEGPHLADDTALEVMLDDRPATVEAAEAVSGTEVQLPVFADSLPLEPPAAATTTDTETDEHEPEPEPEPEHPDHREAQPTGLSIGAWPRRDVRVARAVITLGILLLVELVSVTGLGLMSQQEAPGYQSLVQNVADEVLCPDATPLCETAEGSVQGHVHMVCWQDGLTTYGRWFYIYAPNGTEGFMRAGTVSQQTGTPKCTTLTWINAAWWLLIHDGHMAQLATDAVRDGATANVSWDVLLAYDAWKLGAGHTPTEVGATALQTWALYQAYGRGHAPAGTPPRGSLVFFADGGNGRVALSLGNGWVEIPQQVTARTLGMSDTASMDGMGSGQETPLTHQLMSTLGLVQVGYVAPSHV